MSDVHPPLAAAVIGCGRMGLRHAEAMRSTPGLQLVGVCDLDPDRAQQAAQRFSVPAFTEYRALIATLRPAVAAIATRTAGRCEILEFAARHGLRGAHVEKPLGRSPGECRRALGVAGETGLKLTYGTTRRWIAVYRRARRMALEAGLRGLAIEFDRATLLWTHPHSFDLMVWFANGRDPVAVQAHCSFEPGALQGRLLDADPVVEDARVEFEGGFEARITCTPGMNLRAAIDGGEIVVAANGERLERNAQVLAVDPARGGIHQAGIRQALQELMQAVNSDGGTGILHAEILRSNLLGFACAWSSLERGRRVRLDEVPDDFTITGRLGALYA